MKYNITPKRRARYSQAMQEIRKRQAIRENLLGLSDIFRLDDDFLASRDAEVKAQSKILYRLVPSMDKKKYTGDMSFIPDLREGVWK